MEDWNLMNRLFKFLLDCLVYGFFGLLIGIPIAGILYEAVHLKFEATPFFLFFILLFGGIYYIGLRESKKGIKNCEELAARYGIKFSYSKGYIPGVMYWPTFSGAYAGRTVYAWFRGRYSTGVAVYLSKTYKDVGLDLKSEKGLAAFVNEGMREKLRVVAKSVQHCLIHEQKITAVISGVPGKKQTNDAIGKTIEELVAVAALIDAST